MASKRESVRDDGSPDDRAEDLRLTAACARGDEKALAEFDVRLLSKVARFVARLDPSPSFADEVRQRLRHKLFVPEGGEPPKIATYSGRGPLAAWVRVAAVRVARDMIRARKDGRPVRDEEEAPLQARADDPELLYMKRHYARELRAAFATTLSGLNDRERNILRLYFVDQMSSAQIGALYGVRGATVRVWIKEYREVLLAEMRRLLGARLRVSASELASIVELAKSQMDVSISRLLGPQ